MTNTIQRIIEIPLQELQTERAKGMDITLGKCCCICGKKLKEGASVKYVHLLENGNIVSYDGSDIVGSQGFFPVGNECAKKLTINFSF
jgi:hypothetical protein